MTRKERLQHWLEDTAWVEDLVPAEIVGSGRPESRTTAVHVEDEQEEVA